MSDARVCGNCKFWECAGAVRREPPPATLDDGCGECHKNAPQSRLTDDAGYVLVWPLLTFKDWCGDFERLQSSSP